MSRGGKREGAGRKKGIEKINVSYLVSKAVIEKFNMICKNKSQTVEGLIKNYLDQYKGGE